MKARLIQYPLEIKERVTPIGIISCPNCDNHIQVNKMQWYTGSPIACLICSTVFKVENEEYREIKLAVTECDFEEVIV